MRELMPEHLRAKDAVGCRPGRHDALEIRPRPTWIAWPSTHCFSSTGSKYSLGLPAILVDCRASASKNPPVRGVVLMKYDSSSSRERGGPAS